MKRNQKEMSIMEWLMEESAKGSTLEIVWEGGGDSGWVHFEVDGEQYDSPHAEALIDYMHDELNYGSWAGEFQSNGRAEFNPETKCFEGEDYYTEDAGYSLNTKIDILVPEHLWFDSMSIEFDGHYEDGDIPTTVSFDIKNGFFTPEHGKFEKELEPKLTETLMSTIESSYSGQGEVRGCWDNITINYSQFDKDENPGFLTYTIEKIEISTTDTEERGVCLDLTEIEQVNEKISV